MAANDVRERTSIDTMRILPVNLAYAGDRPFDAAEFDSDERGVGMDR